MVAGSTGEKRLDLFFPHREPQNVTAPPSYYDSPADEDFLYKAKAMFKRVTGAIMVTGLYDGYVYREYRKFVPIVSRMSVYVLPGLTAMGVFIAANAITVKLNKKDTPLCHFVGGFASFAFLSAHFGWGAVYPVGIMAGIASARFRQIRGREIETGKPMFDNPLGKFRCNQNPKISHLFSFPLIFDMPPEEPEY